MGSKEDRQFQSAFKRLARRRSFFAPMPSNLFSPQFDRAGLQIAWKYVYLLRAGRRLTRYVE
jgi:hypothetical protein